METSLREDPLRRLEDGVPEEGPRFVPPPAERAETWRAEDETHIMNIYSSLSQNASESLAGKRVARGKPLALK